VYLEWVGETLRAALNDLAIEATDGLRPQVTADGFERCGTRIEAFRLPKGEAQRYAYAEQIGADGVQWLGALVMKRLHGGDARAPLLTSSDRPGSISTTPMSTGTCAGAKHRASPQPGCAWTRQMPPTRTLGINVASPGLETQCM
jgi:hypothetical protein